MVAISSGSPSGVGRLRLSAILERVLAIACVALPVAFFAVSTILCACMLGLWEGLLPGACVRASLAVPSCSFSLLACLVCRALFVRALVVVCLLRFPSVVSGAKALAGSALGFHRPFSWSCVVAGTAPHGPYCVGPLL